MNKLNRKKRYDLVLIFIIILIIIILTLIIFLLTKVYSSNLNIKEIDNTVKVEENNQQTNTSSSEDENIYNVVINTEVPNNSDNNEKTEELSNPIDNKSRQFGNNVAFIGDSRTQAFLMYTGLSDVVDYTNIGLMVDTAITKKFITNNEGEEITILEDLENRDVDTVYIMLGVNELGWVYNSIFIKKYEELIDKIKEVKPNCEIIVQSIIPVTKTRSDSDNIYNNAKITEYNALIKEMANRKEITFIDLVPALTDENGNLPEAASPDGIHLNKEYCLKWMECLKNN